MVADGGARAAFLQSFVGDEVRPVLRRKIKSNRIGVLLHSPSRKAPARASRGSVDEVEVWPIRHLCFSAIARAKEFGFVGAAARSIARCWALLHPAGYQPCRLLPPRGRRR